MEKIHPLDKQGQTRRRQITTQASQVLVDILKDKWIGVDESTLRLLTLEILEVSGWYEMYDMLEDFLVSADKAKLTLRSVRENL